MKLTEAGSYVVTTGGVIEVLVIVVLVLVAVALVRWLLRRR